MCVSVSVSIRVCPGFATTLCFRKVESFQTTVKYFSLFTFTTIICICDWEYIKLISIQLFIFSCVTLMSLPSWVASWRNIWKGPAIKQNELFTVKAVICLFNYLVLAKLQDGENFWDHSWARWKFLSLPYASKSAICIRYPPYHPHAALTMCF